MRECIPSLMRGPPNLLLSLKELNLHDIAADALQSSLAQRATLVLEVGMASNSSACS